MMIVYKTSLTKIPSNCSECACEWCSVPLCKNRFGGLSDKIKKSYTKTRPKDCPLIQVQVESKEN